MLALAIGANTAIFSVVDAVLLQSLPVRDPGTLRTLEWSARQFHGWYNGDARNNAAGERLNTSFSYPAYLHIRDHSTRFSDVVAFSPRDQVNVNIAGRAELADGQLVSGNFFSGLGVSPVVGRALTPDDDRADAPAVAVLGHGIWQRLFGGDPGILGRTLAVNGTSAVVVGVAPPGFCGLEPGRCVDVFLPIVPLQPALYAVPGILTSGRHHGFPVVARLKPGVTTEQARAETETLVRQVVLANPPEGDYDLPRLTLSEGGQGLDGVRRQLAKPLRILMVVVGAVLLLACANITGLLLTRAAARQREMSTRLALGAGRARLARQLLTESVLLAAMGGTAGVALALALRQVLPYALSPGSEALVLDVRLDWSLLAFITGVCLTAGLLCGLLPALGASRAGVMPTFARGTASGDAGRGRVWTGKSLVVVQVALSLVLLVCAALFVRTLVNLRNEALGFRPSHVLLFQMNAPLSGYEDVRLKDFYEEAVRRIVATPGVGSASISRWGVLAGHRTTDAVNTATNADAPPEERRVYIHYVGPDYFKTMGMSLLVGREVGWADREGAPKVALVNQALAARSFDKGAVEQRFGFGGRESVNEIEVVGVVGDARFSTLREPAPPTVYLPYRQHSQHQMTFAVRTDGEPTAVTESIRQTLAALDANVPMFDIRTQETQIERSVKQERLFAQLLSGFAILAVLLACLGIYGTLAYSVTRRTPEIGVRMALGAERRDVVRMVAGDMAVPLLSGIALGVGGALASTRLLDTMLFGLTPRDVPTLASAAIVLVAAGMLAVWVPSRRAARVDPMIALREE